MKNRLIATLVLATVGALAVEKAADEYRLQVELTDGSRLIGSTTLVKLPLNATVGEMQLPLAALREMEFTAAAGNATCRLRNGDVLTGRAGWSALPLTTLFGRHNIAQQLIRKIRVTTGGASALPPGEGPLAFGGLNWIPLRRQAELQGERLVVLKEPRPGFDYGHAGHGCGGLVFSNIGSEDWRDYRLEFTFGSAMPDQTVGPDSLLVKFHVVTYPENWNEDGKSHYTLEIKPNGAASLGCCYRFFCAQPVGHGNVRMSGYREIARGKGPAPKSAGSHLVLEVQGKCIRAWLDEQPLLEVTDGKMDQPIDGATLDHGGIGLGWTSGYSGWISDFKAQKL